MIYLKTTLFLLGLGVCSPTLMNETGKYLLPRTAAYPFGDEIYNFDMKDSHTQEEFSEVESTNIVNIYTFCSNATFDDDEYYDEELPYNDDNCAKCDLRPTVDKDGVIVECFECQKSDILDGGNILFLTSFLQVSNYSLPDE